MNPERQASSRSLGLSRREFTIGAMAAGGLNGIGMWRSAAQAATTRVQGAGAPELQAFDAFWTKFLEDNSVQAGALAIARNGKLLLTRSYTVGADEPLAMQSSPFRFASCSKLITSIAIHQLIGNGDLELTDHAADILFPLPDLPDMPIISNVWPNVTVEELLTMTSGLQRGFADNDVFVAPAFWHKLPVTEKKEIVRYLLTLPDDQPGVRLYRNTDFFILTAIIEAVTGLPYEETVRQRILEPLGLTRPRPAGSLAGDRVPYELQYHPWDEQSGPNAMSEEPAEVPVHFGTVNLETGLGVGGWLMTAADFAKIYPSLTPDMAGVS